MNFDNCEKQMPAIILGTAPIQEMRHHKFYRLKTIHAVSQGIQLGYGVDCAVAYGNHRQVGSGIKVSGKNRNEIFVTSKLYNNQQNNLVELHYQNILNELDTEYLDLLLLHWPQVSTYINAWKQMEQLYYAGKVRYIGIANVEIRHLLEVEKRCELLPHVIQIERHPLNTQEEILAFCIKKGIKVQSYAPIGRMNNQLKDSTVLMNLSNKYNKTVPQIILRWHIQTNAIPVVRSIKSKRIRDNYNIHDFVLLDKEIEEINNLHNGYKIYDPRRYARYY